MRLFYFLMGLYWACMAGAVMAGFQPSTITVVCACISTGVGLIMESQR